MQDKSFLERMTGKLTELCDRIRRFRCGCRHLRRRSRSRRSRRQRCGRSRRTAAGAVGLQISHQPLLLRKHGLEGDQLGLQLLDGDLRAAVRGRGVLHIIRTISLRENTLMCNLLYFCDSLGGPLYEGPLYFDPHRCCSANGLPKDAGPIFESEAYTVKKVSNIPVPSWKNRYSVPMNLGKNKTCYYFSQSFASTLTQCLHVCIYWRVPSKLLTSTGFSWKIFFTPYFC